MTQSRIDDLRRRVEADPASIAFAQLAEEYRRAGQTDDAVRVAREGLTRHPGYLSARVTLGRALLELGELDDARLELQFVASEAPENLAAVRGLAEIFHREGDAPQALEYFRRALALARHDPELEEIVAQLSRQVGAETAPSNGLSFEEAHQELISAADRVPLAAVPAEPTPQVGVEGSTAPFDFDTLVAALGTPAAPPLVEAVVRGEAPGVFELPDMPSVSSDPFAALEAELRAQGEPLDPILEIASLTPAAEPPSDPPPHELSTTREAPDGPEERADGQDDATWGIVDAASAPTDTWPARDVASPVTELVAPWEPVEPPVPVADAPADGIETPATADVDPPSAEPPAEEAHDEGMAAFTPPNDSDEADANAPLEPIDAIESEAAVAATASGDEPASPVAGDPPAVSDGDRSADVLDDLEDWLHTLQDRSSQ